MANETFELCTVHRDAPAKGRCPTCGRTYCAACEVEDVVGEQSFCSQACLESAADPTPAGTPPAELIDALNTPILAGWRLWISQLGPLNLWVALPLTLAWSLTDRLAPVSEDPEAVRANLLALAAAALPLVLCMPAVGVLLSHAHTQDGSARNPWPQAAARLLPWAITWILFAAASMLGFVLLLLPGIWIGIRLFWADEFALIHGRGPIAALRESLDLTRALGRRIWGFQFVLGFAEYLIVMPLALLQLGLGSLVDTLGGGVAGAVALNLVTAMFTINWYASARAPEVIYFYGIRALRAELPAEEIRGDWVDRHLPRGATARHSPRVGGEPTEGTRAPAPQPSSAARQSARRRRRRR